MLEKILKAGLFDELEPLYPDTDPASGHQTYMVSVASKAFAGAHIMLSDLTPGKFVTVEVFGPMKKTTVTQDEKTVHEVSYPDFHYKLFELLPLPVEVNTGKATRTEWTGQDVNPDVIRRAPFMIYDVLKPCTNVIPAKGEVMALAIRCKVEAQQREVQKWEIVITHDQISRRLTFEAEVFPTAIPEASGDDLKYVNWFSFEGISDYHNAPLHSEKWYGMFEKYLRLGKYGRQNMGLIGAGLIFDYIKGETPKLNTQKLDRIIQIFDKVGIYWIEGCHLAGRKDNEWEATALEVLFTKKEIPGDGEEDLAGMCRQLGAYIKEHGLEGRWIQSLADEPIDCLANAYRKGMDVLKAAMPGIKTLEATIATETIAGTVDYWCPTVDEYEKKQDFFDGRVKEGDKLFVYTCLNPAGNYCNRLLDQERLRAVAIGWSPALYENVDGYLHWGGMSMDRLDFYYLSAPLPDITDYDTERRSSLPAGDPAIMFPGFHQAYSSTRLEAHRIGLEDLVLLKRLKKHAPEKAAEILALVFRGYSDYTKDVAVYRQARRLLLTAVQETDGNLV